jgi:3-methyl-2-oxobutanoate hydroxymethyltransferase
MSTAQVQIPSDASRLPVTLGAIAERKRIGQKLVMVTAYDYPSALAAEAAGVDIVLVGDSGAMTVLGYDSTLPVTLDEMLMLTKAVRRGLKTPLLVGDMPFGSYEASDELAVRSAQRFVKEAGCDAVKLEGGSDRSLARAKAIIECGIPVMGHVGLTPQSATALGGDKAQGRNAAAALRIAEEARALQAAGCFSIVFEAIPSALTTEIMKHIAIPVIGIGAGAAVDGQVLVFHDILGIREGRGPKFVQRYGELLEDMTAGLSRFADDVRERRFPTQDHEYSIDADELAEFRATFTPR